MFEDVPYGMTAAETGCTEDENINHRSKPLCSGSVLQHLDDDMVLILLCCGDLVADGCAFEAR